VEKYLISQSFSCVPQSNPTQNAAATKRNKRKIQARKFLATPEGQTGLAKRLEEQAEIKLARAANTIL